MTAASDHLDDVCVQLLDAAARLRGGELAPDEAATLVDQCARLAADSAAELERQVRAGAQASSAHQGKLL